MSLRKTITKKSYIRSFLRYLAVLLLVLLQLALIAVTVILFNKYLAYLYVLIEIGSVLIMFPLISHDRNSYNKIYWLCVVLVLPVAGHIMYQLWGRERANYRKHRTIQQVIDSANQGQIMDEAALKDLESQNVDQAKIARYLMNAGFGLYGNNQFKYFPLGEDAFADMEQKIKEAEKYIFISFFTISEGQIWDSLKDDLIERCQKGVKIYIMYDDVGSVLQISDTTVEELKKAGMVVETFNPVEHSFYSYFFNYRNHQKMLIIDGKYGYTGGVNISDRYANINSPYGHWKDVAVRIEGDAVYSMQLIFMGMFNTFGTRIDIKDYPFVPSGLEGNYCIPFADGPSNNPDNPASDVFVSMIASARKEVNITTPYLIIDDTMMDTLCITARSGVKVRIITPGIPDKKYVKLLTERHYGPLLEAGVEIYEYTPGFIHAKMCMNEHSAVVGTVNMDFRSFYMNYEDAVWIPACKTSEDIKEDFENTIQKCRQITYSEWKKRPWYKKLAQEILYIGKCQM